MIFGIPYERGSFWDTVVEAYAGSHDFLNSFYWYDSLGNARHLTGAKEWVGEGMNWANVLLATPFAASILLDSGVWNALNTLMK